MEYDTLATQILSALKDKYTRAALEIAYNTRNRYTAAAQYATRINCGEFEAIKNILVLNALGLVRTEEKVGIFGASISPLGEKVIESAKRHEELIQQHEALFKTSLADLIKETELANSKVE